MLKYGGPHFLPLVYSLLCWQKSTGALGGVNGL